jgi:hypothetical protein
MDSSTFPLVSYWRIFRIPQLEKEGDDFVLYDRQSREQEEQGELRVVWEDGKSINPGTVSEVRNRIDAEIIKCMDKEGLLR